MTAALAVLTCDRPEPLLDRTLRALERGGALELEHAAVFADGCDPDVPGWEVRPGFPRSGIRAQMWRAFTWAAELGADRLIIAEDDITPVKHLCRYLARATIPEHVAFVDLHDMKERREGGNVVGRCSDCGVWFESPVRQDECPACAGQWAGYLQPSARLEIIECADAQVTGGYWGNQLALFPRRTVDFLAAWDPFGVLSQYRRPDGFWTAADVVVGYFVARSPWPRWAVHLPRLSRHDGIHSAAHPEKPLEGHRATANFPGEDFDALSLL